MATAPIEVTGLPTGLTLTADLYPLGSDTITGAAALSLTERTNGKGIYRTTTTAAITGWHRALIKNGSDVIAIYDIYMDDTTAEHYCYDHEHRDLDVILSTRSSHAAADIWSVGTRLLTAGTNIVLAKGVGVTGFTDLSAAQVANAVWDELKASHTVADSFGDYLDDEITSRMATFTLPTNFSSLGINASGHISRVTLVDTLTTYTGDTPQTGDAFARIGANGAGLSAVPWNASWDAEVQSEVDDALRALFLDKLVSVSGTADSGSTTTMVDAARTEGDADYWKGQVIVFTSGTLAGQARIITDFNQSTDTFTFSPATTQAVGTHTYVIVPHVSAWDDVLAEHLASGTTGNALNAAGSAGDPWSTALPGAYGAGSAGFILGTNLDALISSRMATFTLPTNFSSLGINASGHISRVTLVDTLTTYTGNTPQTGDAFARIGAAGAGLTALGDTRIANLDAAVSSRMATFTLPTNFSALGINASGHVSRVTLVDTITTYTGNTVQTGDAFARIGVAGAGLTALGDTRIANLDATVSSRLASASYTTPPTAGANATAVWGTLISTNKTAKQVLGYGATALVGLISTAGQATEVFTFDGYTVNVTVDSSGNRSGVTFVDA